jgi:FkbM family methyltransferase
MYSQNNEEEIILDFFGDFKGTLLDIGANDGKTLSNSLALIEHGWKAVLVEPSQVYYSLVDLHKERTGKVQFLPYAVSNYNGEASFFESGTHLNKGDSGLLSTLNVEEVKRWGDTTDFNTVDIDVIDFKSLLEMSRYKNFDCILIDIEGEELKVLPQIDFDSLGTRLVCVEWNSKDFPVYETIMKDFTLLHKNAENLIYVKN